MLSPKINKRPNYTHPFLQLTHKFDLSVHHIVVGETLEDLMLFDAKAFVAGLLPESEQEAATEEE
jgi:hypothetical protein